MVPCYRIMDLSHRISDEVLGQLKYSSLLTYYAFVIVVCTPYIPPVSFTISYSLLFKRKKLQFKSVTLFLDLFSKTSHNNSSFMILNQQR